MSMLKPETLESQSKRFHKELDNLDLRYREREYLAREMAFRGGTAFVTMLVAVFHLVNKYGFDGELEQFLQNNWWGTLIWVVFVLVFWKISRYVLVDAYDPDREEA